MAGEWLALDIGLPEKPETLELVDVTGEPVEVVVYRLYRLWSWASLNTADGTARMTLARIARVAGGDVDFWQAVVDVGWLLVDGETMTIPGWDRRFSQAAKARMQHRDRAADQEERRGRLRGSAGTACATAQERKGEEKRSPPPPREASPGEAWQTLRQAWNAGPGKPWKPAEPPDGVADRLGEPGWLAEAVEAIPRLAAARYFRTPVTLVQFSGAGFVRRLAGGQYDEPRNATPGAPGAGRSAAEAAAEWERGAAEGRRRTAEYLAAKGRRGKPAAELPPLPPEDESFDTAAARAAAMKALTEATQ